MGLGLALLLCGVGLLSVTMCSQPTIILVVEPGDNVTLWYHYRFTGREECIHWLKQANNSVPELLLSVFNISFETRFDEHSRVKVFVNSTTASLRITNVNYTDSGLYFSCAQLRDKQIVISNGTLLQVEDEEDYYEDDDDAAAADDDDDAADDDDDDEADPDPGARSSDIFFTLTVIFGVTNVVLLIAFLILLMKRK